MIKWFALFILSSVCWKCVAQEAPKSTLSKADWLADLDYASQEMPRKHKNLFHSMRFRRQRASQADLRGCLAGQR
jgi:hypothetical protein